MRARPSPRWHRETTLSPDVGGKMDRAVSVTVRTHAPVWIVHTGVMEIHANSYR